MKQLSSKLAAHYAGPVQTLARLWKVVRTDTAIFCFTDHYDKITRDGLTYLPSSSFDASAVTTKDDLSVDNMELQGLLAGDGITAADIEAGLWDGAKVTLYEVDYTDPVDANILRYGEIGEIQRKPEMYVAELRGLAQKLQNNIGRIVMASCDAELGDARCKVDLEVLRVAGTVTAVTSSRLFTTTLIQAIDYFTYGVVTWVTGANAGRRMEVKRYTPTTGVELQLDMARPIVAGDAFTITPGCNKIGRSAATLSSVSGVTSSTVFTASGLAQQPAGTFTGAALTWTSGGNSGQTVTVTTFDSGGVFTLPSAESAQIGDRFSLIAATDISQTVGDCSHKFNNLINFRGFEDVPGQDKLYLYGGQ